jgi:hypothetical protein
LHDVPILGNVFLIEPQFVHAVATLQHAGQQTSSFISSSSHHRSADFPDFWFNFGSLIEPGKNSKEPWNNG